jgi:multidrug/hemolysin transport system ATP-binding protein
LVNVPALLLLDDVAAGLDAEAAASILDLARRLPRETGAGVLQTTRDIREVAGADRIAILDQGRILAEGTPAQLVDRFAADRLRLVPRPDPGCRMALVRLLGDEGYRFLPGNSPDSPAIEVAIGNSMGALLLVNRTVHLIDSFEMLRGDLKDACDQALSGARSGAGGLSAAMEGMR